MKLFCQAFTFSKLRWPNSQPGTRSVTTSAVKLGPQLARLMIVCGGILLLPGRAHAANQRHSEQASQFNRSGRSVLNATTTSLALDHASIKKQAGCFDVTYDFKETFPLQSGYQIQPDYHAEVFEYAVVDQELPDAIYMQHILLPDGINALKHWRQEWLYESDQVFDYKSNDLWTKRHLSKIESAGQWTERVLNVDDSPQYECSAPWVHWGDQDYWECSAWSPLPRREYSHRRDYNVLARRNREQINSSGWLHEQDNIKTLVNATGVQPLVQERGENHYRRAPDEKCAAAAQWWSENKDVWHSIQKAWRDYYAMTENIQLIHSGTPLNSLLDDLADDAVAKKMSPQEIERETRLIIDANTAH